MRIVVVMLTMVVAAPLIAQGYDWEDMSQETNMQLAVVHAIALEESRKSVGNGIIMPWPWTLQHKGKSYFLDTQAEAVTKLYELLATGSRNIDIGPLQINLKYNGGLVEKPEHLLDPNINLWAAAQVLNQCGEIVGWSLSSRIACYHGGPKRPVYSLRYAKRVLKRAIYLESIRK